MIARIPHPTRSFLVRLRCCPATLWLVAFLLPGNLLPLSVHAQTPTAIPDKCEICDKPLIGDIYYSTDPVRKVKRHFCATCSDSPDTCWACGLPVIDSTKLALSDGRLLCRWDAEGAVISPQVARNLFYQHVREWQRMLSPWPPLPDHNVHFHLVDKDDFLREYRERPHLDSPEALQGLTHSLRNEDGKIEHHIYVLTGLLPNQFLSICAHEYAHTWLYEQETPKRQLHRDTVEGFCEWIAYRYMTTLKDKVEQDRILGNKYTRGQVHAFLSAEKKQNSYLVMEWVLKGVDSWIDRHDTSGILNLRQPTAAPPAAPPPALPLEAVETPVPDVLTLKGITLAGRRSFALINNQTLSAGESAKVRVGDTTVQVRCLEIRKGSVLIQVQDEANPRELTLPKPGQ